MTNDSVPATEQRSALSVASAAGDDDLASSGEQEAQGRGFTMDSHGRLVRNEAARLELEQLHALNTPAELEVKLQELDGSMPPEAAREVRDLMERYANYSSAQRQNFPPGQEAASPEEALNQVDGMHALRVQYFGADTTEAFYGSEERMQRELLRLMSLEKDESLTMSERAERAQALYREMPETTARTERENSARESSPDNR